jgi:hypothetical protein
MMRATWLYLAVPLALGSAACAASAPARQAPPAVATSPRVAALDTLILDMCPMHVDAATVRAEELELGAALVFETTGDVAELRRRVRLMADMDGRNREAIATRRPEGSPLPPARRMLGDVEAGAQILFHAPHASALDELRASVAAQAAAIADGACPVAMPRAPAPAEGDERVVRR